MEAELGGAAPTPPLPRFPSPARPGTSTPGETLPSQTQRARSTSPSFYLYFFEASINDSSGTEPSMGPGTERCFASCSWQGRTHGQGDFSAIAVRGWQGARH